MSRALGIVVAVQAAGTATIHYTDCKAYQRARCRELPIPAGAKVRLCRQCRPAEEDVRAHPPAVEWYQFSPDGRSKRVSFDMEWVDKLRARRDYGYGRRLPPRGWSG